REWNVACFGRRSARRAPIPLGGEAPRARRTGHDHHPKRSPRQKGSARASGAGRSAKRVVWQASVPGVQRFEGAGSTRRADREPARRGEEGDVSDAWPALPYEAWKDTYATLHMWSQIVGKIALA